MTYNISCIIPTYNRARTIKRCLDSIIGQSYALFEVIIVDDCSSDVDDLSRIVLSYHDDRIRLIASKEHIGAQGARDCGVNASKGNWIAFCDSDDEWLPDKLERQVEMLKETNCLVAAGACIKDDGNERAPWLDDGVSGEIFEKVISRSTYIMYQSLLVNKDCLYDIGGIDRQVPAYQEWDLAIRLAESFSICFANDPLFIYHTDVGDSMFRTTEQSIKGLNYIYQKYKRKVWEKLGFNGLRYWYVLKSESCMYPANKVYILLAKVCHALAILKKAVEK